MKKIITLLLASTIVLQCSMIAFADTGTLYPLKLEYQSGIDNVNFALFSNSEISKPIETGFEDSGVIEEIRVDDYEDQIAISENSYSGKFSLKINKKNNDIIPIHETEYFQTGDVIDDITDSDLENVSYEDNYDIEVLTNGRDVTVLGSKMPGEYVSILVEKDTEYVYADQTVASDDGSYYFEFSLNDYGNYKFGIGGSQSVLKWLTVEISEKGSTSNITPSTPISKIDVKNNIYNIMVKPMYKAERISFYIKTDDSLGEYALLKGDENNDGVFEVGEDLSRGKWQKIQLDLTDIDESLKTGMAAGLYMTANEGSEWLFDDISSDYKVINEQKIDLSSLTKENVIFTDNTLHFSYDATGKTYNVSDNVVVGGISAKDQLSEINIESSVVFSGQNSEFVEMTDQGLFNIPFKSEEWIVNKQTDSSESRKESKVYYRDKIPALSTSGSVNIESQPKKEKRFRLVLENSSSTSGIVTIQVSGSDTQKYQLKDNRTYTDWYTDDITVTSSRSSLKLLAIEYEKENESEKEVLLCSGDSVEIDLGELSTEDRTKLTYEIANNKRNTDFATGDIMFELFENDAETPYYYAKPYVPAEVITHSNSFLTPKIKGSTKLKITNLGSNELRISNVKFSKLKESDWNLSEVYKNKNIVKSSYELRNNGNSNIKSQEVSTVLTLEEEYAAIYVNASGIVNISEENTSWSGIALTTEHDFVVCRILNLETSPTYIGTSTMLDYGISDYKFSSRSSLTLPNSDKVFILSLTYYKDTENNTNNINYINIDGAEDIEMSPYSDILYYKNVYETSNQDVYSYDLITKEKNKFSNDRIIASSLDKTKFLMKNSNGEYYILDALTQEKTSMGKETISSAFFNTKNELFISRDVNEQKVLYSYTHNGLQKVYTFSSNSKNLSLNCDPLGRFLICNYGSNLYIFKETNELYNLVKSVNIVSDSYVVLSNDGTTAYYNTTDAVYSIDITSEIKTEIFSGTLHDMTKDGKLLVTDKNNYHYLLNPITGEKNKLFSYAFRVKEIYYNSDNNIVKGIAANGRIFYHVFNGEVPDVKYALSFDGKNNWIAYNGGRWITVSKSSIPSVREMQLTGMAADVVNGLGKSAYDKLYINGDDILTVDVAIYMNSKYNNQTPVIKDITFKMEEDNELDGVYGIHLEKYNKDDYRNVNALFPIENFGSSAECYYLLYIGNDWLYTYKNNEVIKLEKSADELLANMGENWLEYKQYGMSAKELRQIPGAVLSNLFVNENYANTEFGVIYVVKAKDNSTKDYTVNFRLSASSNYIDENDIVVEITMMGGEVKVIDSAEYDDNDIKDLLSWIENRQNSNSEAFFRIKNEKEQHFINYYTINSISIYQGEEYRGRQNQ